MKEKCLEKLQGTFNNYLDDKCNTDDTNIINLLKEIIVVEKEYLDGEKLFNQLKESYFGNDDTAASFVMGLYDYNKETIETYIDIYLEQAYESEMNDNDINNKIIKLNNLLTNINPEFVMLIETKINNINK